MKWLTLLVLVLVLSACSSVVQAEPDQKEEPVGFIEPVQDEAGLVEDGSTVINPENAQTFRSDLADLGPAPELENEVWLNTDQPLTLEKLRGKVVLLDMWTFG